MHVRLVVGLDLAREEEGCADGGLLDPVGVSSRSCVISSRDPEIVRS